LHDWSGSGLPPDAAFDALARDLIDAKASDRLYEFAKSFNSHLGGARSQVLKTSRALGDPALAADTPDASAKRIAALKAVPFWNSVESWSALKGGASGFTSFYLLSALDLRWTADGGIAGVPPEQAVFVRVFGRTFL